jgi:hypothetical protein
MSLQQIPGTSPARSILATSLGVLGQSVMPITALHLALLAGSSAAGELPASGSETAGQPLYLTAQQMSIATGQPSLLNMTKSSTHLPVWSLSGGTVGQSVCAVLPRLPAGCAAVKVEALITSTSQESSADYADVYRVILSQIPTDGSFPARQSIGTPVRSALAAPFHTRSIVLAPYYPVDADAPLYLRVQREPGDPADTFPRPTGLIMLKITPLPALSAPYVVQDRPGYNSWPMLQALGDKLVCVYSRGSGHTIGEPARAVYARCSQDGGRSWAPETVVTNSPRHGEVAIGKGLDENGEMLLWVRCIGPDWHHDLFRTKDGLSFERIATPTLDPMPMQITDVFSVPTVGLMALWFAGDYSKDGPCHHWGTLVSKDNGLSWTQKTVEADLPKAQWPTEPAAVYLGDGKILAIARTELGDNSTARTQFQLFSSDYGQSWSRSQSNIGNVRASTPSLILDAGSGLLSNYYYERGHGVLWRRVVKPEDIIDNPLGWPEPEAIAVGSAVTFDAGNVNATAIDKKHYLAFYSGEAPDTAVVIAEQDAPTND